MFERGLNNPIKPDLYLRLLFCPSKQYAYMLRCLDFSFCASKGHYDYMMYTINNLFIIYFTSIS